MICYSSWTSTDIHKNEVNGSLNTIALTVSVGCVPCDADQSNSASFEDCIKLNGSYKHLIKVAAMSPLSPLLMASHSPGAVVNNGCLSPGRRNGYSLNFLQCNSSVASHSADLNNGLKSHTVVDSQNLPCNHHRQLVINNSVTVCNGHSEASPKSFGFADSDSLKSILETPNTDDKLVNASRNQSVISNGHNMDSLVEASRPSQSSLHPVFKQPKNLMGSLSSRSVQKEICKWAKCSTELEACALTEHIRKMHIESQIKEGEKFDSVF